MAWSFPKFLWVPDYFTVRVLTDEQHLLPEMEKSDPLKKSRVILFVVDIAFNFFDIAQLCFFSLRVTTKAKPHQTKLIKTYTQKNTRIFSEHNIEYRTALI